MITLSAVFGAALFSLVFKTSDFISARASNVNVLSVQTEEITASNYEMYSSSGAPLQIGDYALHFVIHNNTGYAGMGLSAFYDNTIFEIYCSDNALLEPYFIQGSASAGLLLNCNNNAATGCIGFSTAGLHNCIHDGIIVTVFAARKPDAEDEETPLLGYLGELTNFKDSDTVKIEEHEEEVTQETEYRIMREILYYRLGDINGDGIVDTDDAVILLNILNQYGTITEANAAQAFANCAGMFATDMLGDPVFILDAAHRPCACLQKKRKPLDKNMRICYTETGKMSVMPADGRSRQRTLRHRQGIPPAPERRADYEKEAACSTLRSGTGHLFARHGDRFCRGSDLSEG